VKDSLRAPLLLSQADSWQATRPTSCPRHPPVQQISLDDLAKQYHLNVNETRPISATDPLLELADSKDAKNAIFSCGWVS